MLHRIRAVRSFDDVQKGDLGGYIEHEKNLSHKGKAWIYDNSIVLDNALVSDNAEVSGDAVVNGEE